MNTLTAVRLGKVDAGKLITKSDNSEKENIAAPIVLWGKDAAAAGVLYFNKEGHRLTGSFSQTIDYLESPAKSLKERLKSMTGAYPITFKAIGLFEKDDEKDLNAIIDVYTKDINGDGIDELIITRNKGGIEVYDREKQILKYKPKSDPKLYAYEMKDLNFTNLGDHDEIFFTVDQDPYYNKHITARDTWIVRVSQEGISEINPVFADHSEPSSIVSVVGMNRPGSRVVDELVVISTLKDRKGYYLSRHKLDGTAIDTPREIYTDYSIYCGAFGFSGSNQIIINNGQEKMLYFVTPDKPVNWIKTINLKKLFGSDTKARIIGEKVINNLAVLVLEDHGKLYALDALGKFHTSMNPDSHTGNEAVAFMTLKPDSNKHKIVKITPTDKTMESYLVIQSRYPGRQELTNEELEKAGKRFLTDDDWKDCKEELKLKYYNDITPELAESYCKRNNIPMPRINSWDDIKEKLPGYYAQEIMMSKHHYYRAIERRLFRPIDKERYVLVEDDYKNIAEYKKWLDSMFVAPELVISIQHISKGNIGHQRLADYYFEDLAAGSGFSQPSINVRTNGEHGRAFMALHRKAEDRKNTKPAYYGIAW